MKCKDCNACKKGWFSSNSDEYACIGVPEPFVIDDINAECTEYEDIHNTTGKEYICKNFTKEELLLKLIKYSPCGMDEFGIITDYDCDGYCEKCLNSKVIRE